MGGASETARRREENERLRPGNVREIQNCLERAVIESQDEVIHSHHLSPTLQTAEASGTEARGTLGIAEPQMGLRVDRYGIDARRFRKTR